MTTSSLPTPAEVVAAVIAREKLPPEKGDIGPQGPDGKAGEFGPPGPQGAKGDPGRNGTNGSNGNVGPKGPQGNGGPRGPKGEKGDKGDEGERGPIGPMGPTGAVGSGKALFPRPGGGSGGGAPSGAAGGDLSGTYPNPSVANDSHSHTASTVTGFVTNPLTADLDVGAFVVRAADVGDDQGGRIEALPGVLDAGGSITVTGGWSNTSDGTGGLGTFEGGNGWHGGRATLVAGTSLGAGEDGGYAEVTGGAADGSGGTFGGNALVVGGLGAHADGTGGDAILQGGASLGSGAAAEIKAEGMPATSGDGLIQLKTDGSTGVAGEFLGSNGSGKTVWQTPTVRTGAGAPSGAPGVGELPFAYNTTAVTGGFYYWNGSAWVKVATIL